MKGFSHDRVAHLTEELERVRRELAQLQQATTGARPSGLLRSGRLQMAAPLLLLGAWLLSAGAPPNQDDLEERVSELEARLLKGPGTTTRIQAPFEVVGAGGNVILQVSQAFPTVSNGVGIFWQGKDGGVTVSRSGHDIAGMGTAESGEGGLLFIGDQYGVPRAEVGATDGVSVMNGGGKVVASMVTIEGDEGRVAIMRGDRIIAAMEGGDEGGLLDIADENGKSRAQVGVEDGNGYVATLDPKGHAEVEMGISDGGEGQLSVNHKGKLRASLGTRIGAGYLSISSAKDQPVVNATGGDNGGIVRVADASGKPAAGILGDKRAVVVANSTGKVVAEMLASGTTAGLFQAWGEGKLPLVVIGQAPGGAGGIVQVSNGQVPVSSILASDGGAGRWQLSDASGAPMVEAGVTTQGKGTVRAGPKYLCGMRSATVGVVGAAILPPDCIVGVR